MRLTRSTGRTGSTRTTAVAALAAVGVLALALAGCGGDDKGDTAACKSAMSKQFEQAAGQKLEEQVRPGACDGLDQMTIDRLIHEVVAEQTKNTPSDWPDTNSG